MTATMKNREVHWRNWLTYVQPLGVNAHLHGTPFKERVRTLTGFCARNRTGYYGRGKQIQSGTVSSALSAAGTQLSLATNLNPTKVHASDK